MKIPRLLLLITAGVLLASCGDDGAPGAPGATGAPGAAGPAGASSLVVQTSLPFGDANCTFGGVQIQSGLDTDGDGSLTDAEVTASDFVCAADTTFQLQLLHFADVDGGGDTEVIANANNFSAVLDNFRGDLPNTVVLSSGDNWIPSPLFELGGDPSLAALVGEPDPGRAHIAWLNAMGVQASALGNHEFDLGTGDLVDIFNQDGAFPGAQFPYLSGNLDFSSSDDFTDDGLIGTDGAPVSTLSNNVAGSTVIVVNGEAIGVVGATTPTLDVISSPEDVVVSPADDNDIAALAAVIQEDVDALTAQGVDKIILLAHMQLISVEEQLATLLNDVDIIVAGGSNTILADSNDRLRPGDTAAGTYPMQFTSPSGDPVMLVNVDGDFNYLGRLVVNFDDSGAIIPALLDDTLNGPFATDDDGLATIGLASDDAISEVADISTALSAALAAVAGNVVGRTSVGINGERRFIRSEETNLGNLICEADVDFAQSVDPTVSICIANGGGIRTSIGQVVVPPGSNDPNDVVITPPAGIAGINNAGDITQLDIQGAIPFNNDLVALTVTGTQLVQLLENGVSEVAPGAEPGAFPQVNGLRFSFDPTETAQVTVDNDGLGFGNPNNAPPMVTTPGSRIRNLVVLDPNGAAAGATPTIVVQDGTLVAPNATFRVVTNLFLAVGGDSYPFPNGADVAADFLDLTAAFQATNPPAGSLTFAEPGEEQDVVAEFLATNFPNDDDPATPEFSVADTPAEMDLNIQNLSVVASDTVISSLSAP